MFTSSLEVAWAVWVTLYAFPAFILYPKYPFLANLGWDTGLDGPVVWLSVARIVFWWGTFSRRSVYTINRSPLALQGDQRTKNKESMEKDSYTQSNHLSYKALFHASKILNSFIGKIISSFYRIIALLKLNF